MFLLLALLLCTLVCWILSPSFQGKLVLVLALCSFGAGVGVSALNALMLLWFIWFSMLVFRLILVSGCGVVVLFSLFVRWLLLVGRV